MALELFDKDGDGAIAGAELDASPGIKAALGNIDADKNGQVTADEIAARIQSWQESRYGVMPLGMTFTLDGQPLVGATVRFEPEPFLGEEIKAAVGETSSAGQAFPTVPKEQRATSDTPAGLQLGLYRIVISAKDGDREKIPAKFNSPTTLGQEIAMDDPAIASQRVRFDLKSK